ncbi:hypothetical protein J4219_04685 [Candidatus Woesearchaeota archaeon]|nr:hypothetical protein [Candidatus Woesearchaeota archaeon]
MATKEETYEVILADLRLIWTSVKSAAVSWKKMPSQRLSTVGLPICTTINQTISHADALQKNTDPQTRVLLEYIKERLAILKQELIKSEKIKSISNATDLLNTCKTTLQSITTLVIAKTETAKTLYSELAATLPDKSW